MTIQSASCQPVAYSKGACDYLPNHAIHYHFSGMTTAVLPFNHLSMLNSSLFLSPLANGGDWNVRCAQILWNGATRYDPLMSKSEKFIIRKLEE